MKASLQVSPDQKQKIDTYLPAKVNRSARRILILMSDTGGGHRAAAEAIQEGLEFLYPCDVSVTIVDAWRDYLRWPFNRIANSYGWIVNETLWLWKGMWHLEKHRWMINSFYATIYPLVQSDLLRLFVTQRPDLIISVHPLLTQFSLQTLERSQLNIPFVTVVTDMIKSWHVWYRPSTTLCLVPTPAIARQAIQLGVAAHKVSVVGQPVTLRLKLDGEKKEALRRRLGFHPNRPVILVAGGGEGFGPILEIVQAIARRVKQCQLIVVAGRNRRLFHRLNAVDWKIPTITFGFVENMPELMQAADLFITKAGPSSICEAFVAGLPLILFDYIPGQEDANVQYVQQHNAGVYTSDPQKIAALLEAWLRPNNGTLQEMAQNAASLAQPEAALAVARQAYRLID